MGRALRELHKRKTKKLGERLADLLSRADDASFLRLAWAVNMLQSPFKTDVRRYLNYPKDAQVTKIDSPFFVYKWDIETLLLLLLSTPKLPTQPGPNKLLDCTQFGAMAMAVNLLRSLENYESGASIDGSDILKEMHRIGHRQFAWQRGFATAERLYRYAFIYGQEGCAAYFHEKHGLTVQQFLEVNFALYALLHAVPWTKPPDLKVLGLEPELLGKTLPLISLPLPEMRVAVKSLIDAASAKNVLRVAYLPSALRQYPIIRADDHGTIIAPLPELIILRATAGLYYEIRRGPQGLITEANDRFEKYTRKVIEAFCPRFRALPSERYGPRKSAIDTPDVLLMDGGEVVAVAECKATKLTHEAQFAENPVEEANRAYAQIAKGIAQLWRFFSHVRRGVYQGQNVAPDAHGILVAMEAWMQFSEGLREQVFSSAKEMLRADPDITDADMRPIIFCSIQELVDVMFVSDAEAVRATFQAAELPKYHGWGLREVRRATGMEEVARPFPLDVGELIPWWGRYRNDRKLS